MLKQLYCALLIALAAPLCHAQTASLPGYVVSLAGDTTRGVVANQAGGRAALSCRFKPAPQAEFTTYSPAQLQAYGTAAYAYQTHVVPLEAQAAEPRFLAVVERGPVSLLLLIDAGAHERYFIRQNAAASLELRRVVRPRPDLPGSIVETNNYYRSELVRAFQDCPAAQRRAQQASFNLGALQQVVRYYNNCRQPTPANPATTASANSSRVRLSAVYSLPVYNTFRLGEGHGRVPADDKLRGGFYGSGGLLVAFSGRYHSSHVAFLTGLFCELNRAYSTQQAYPNLSYNLLYQHSQLAVSLDYLKLPLLLRYSWSGATVRPYAEAGLYVRALLGLRHNTVEDTYATTLPIYNQRYDLLQSSQNITPAPVLGIGVRLGAPTRRCLTVGAQAELASGPQLASNPAHYDYTSQLLSVSVLLAYDLTK